FLPTTLPPASYTPSLHDALPILRRLRDPAVYDELERRGARLEAGLAQYGRLQRVGAMATLFMTDDPVRSFDDAQKSDTERYGAQIGEHTSELQSPDHLVCRLLLE